MPPEDPSTNLPQPLLDDIDDLGMDAASLAALAGTAIGGSGGTPRLRCSESRLPANL